MISKISKTQWQLFYSQTFTVVGLEIKTSHLVVDVFVFPASTKTNFVKQIIKCFCLLWWSPIAPKFTKVAKVIFSRNDSAKFKEILYHILNSNTRKQNMVDTLNFVDLKVNIKSYSNFLSSNTRNKQTFIIQHQDVEDLSMVFPILEESHLMSNTWLL